MESKGEEKVNVPLKFRVWGGQEDSSIQPPHNHYALAMCQALLLEYLVLNRTDLRPAL